MAEPATFEVDGRRVRDLNGNGELDPYEDPRRPVEERVDDLLAQMTLEEKAGLMFHPPIFIGPEGELLDGPSMFGGGASTRLVTELHLNHFNVYATPDARRTAEWHNRLQQLAESTRLGIPVTISSDPRHAFDENPATSWASGSLSQWPEPIGLAATRDEELVRSFGEIARQEYRAIGIHVALHPMADVATEPRWARIAGTFGEDFDLAGRMTAAYIHGFQGDELGPESVACMTKHFPGGGPQADGEDAHFPYGKDQVYPGGRFEDHLRPFESAFAAGTAQIMPYYGRPLGTDLEPVGFGFNKGVITDMLRGRYGFDGVVCTDWALVSDTTLPDGSVWLAKAWGVEELDAADRLAKIIEAGCDQLGGESLPELLVELVRSGRIAESRIDESARRILRDKFRLGLFDDPYVDPDAAARICGSDGFRAAGLDAQRRSIVLLANDGVLPLAAGSKVYVDGLPAAAAAAYGEVVATPADADVADRLPPGAVRAAHRHVHRVGLPRRQARVHRGGARQRAGDGRCRSDRLRRQPRASGRDHRDRRGEQRGGRHVRREPRGDPRRRLRPVLARRQAAVRAAVVPGRGGQAALRTCRSTRSRRCTRSGTASRTAPRSTRAPGSSRCRGPPASGRRPTRSAT